MKIQRYGWIPDFPDRTNDRVFVPKALRLDPAGNLPVNLLPPVFNQGHLGSCTGASTGRGSIMYLIAKENQPRNMMSALFAYYNARLLEGNQKSDVGAQIRDVLKGIIKYGLCAESLHPYVETSFAIKPSDKAYHDGSFTEVDSYERIDEVGSARLTPAKAAIAQGWPINFGFTVYESFESQEVARTGLMPMPLSSEAVVGGHAVWAFAYDDSRGFRIRNSWGPDWGIHGDFWMPYDYFANDGLVTDLWVPKSV